MINRNDKPQLARCRNWITVEFGKYADSGMSLPQIVFNDPDWFFWLADQDGFDYYGTLGKQARRVARNARHIVVPSREPGDYNIWYWFDRDGRFSHLEVADADRTPHRGSGLILTSDLIDLSLLRHMKNYDKRGNRALIQQVKAILFGNSGVYLTRARCEAFFDDPDNFG